MIRFDCFGKPVKPYVPAFKPDNAGACSRYYRKNTEKWRAYNQARRSALGRLTSQDIREIQARDGGFCAYCLKPGATDLEHCTPLARGGANAPDNVVMACRKCNQKKRTKTVLEFLVL